MRTKNIAMILTLALTAGLCQTAAPSQAATPKLSAKKLTMKVGKTAVLKVKKTSKTDLQGDSVWPNTTMCNTDTKPDRDSKCYTDGDSGTNQHPNADAGSHKSAGAYS